MSGCASRRLCSTHSSDGPCSQAQLIIAPVGFTLPYLIFPKLGGINCRTRRSPSMSIITRVLTATPVAMATLCVHVLAGDLAVVGTGDGVEALRVLGASYTADNAQTGVRVPPS